MDDLLRRLVDADRLRYETGEDYHLLVRPVLVELSRRVFELEDKVCSLEMKLRTHGSR